MNLSALIVSVGALVMVAVSAVMFCWFLFACYQWLVAFWFML